MILLTWSMKSAKKWQIWLLKVIKKYMTKTKTQIKTRFAPSPTGAPHVGNIRTALFEWLFARANKGAFLLRVEDTDQSRAIEGSVEQILKALDWLGIDIDEGVIAHDKDKGSEKPYFQSKRLDIYREHAQKLLDKGHAFYCFCSEERLREMREDQQKAKLPPKYDGFCLELSKDEVDEKLKNGEKYVIRMKIPEDGATSFQDAIKGHLVIQNKTIDCQVLIKSDKFPTYHLASVVDDHLMEITHVIRADEWLSSTPKHVLLYKYFGWDEPIWVHLPIILGTDKSKLSKRHGAVSVMEYREQGYLPEAMINFLALLGWNPKTDQEILSVDEIIAQFDIKKINKNNPIFDVTKLNWMNNQYIQKKSVDELACLIDSVHDRNDIIFKKAIALVQDRLEKLSDFDDLTLFLWKLPEYSADILVPKELDKPKTKRMLEIALGKIEKEDQFNEKDLRETFLEYCEHEKLKRGDFLWPLRVAITGMKNSPEVFAVMDILGKDESTERVKEGIGKL
ncbi:MAG: glutamate--tRNA ligase [Parcubacteria group bacterium CG_4_10_14_0_2_um_filter_41_6]|nr:MAG: glutamate--tRNA ligase [Parcubacteria group bacterium CG_4_10_14_0_2_um_filter_41_6]